MVKSALNVVYSKLFRLAKITNTPKPALHNLLRVMFHRSSTTLLDTGLGLNRELKVQRS